MSAPGRPDLAKSPEDRSAEDGTAAANSPESDEAARARAGRGVRAGLDKRPDEVAAMFDQVARRYDVTNAVLSVGMDRGWRKATAAALRLAPGQRVLDLAAGTATSSRAFAAAGTDVLACDFSVGMLRAGQARLARRPPTAGTVRLVAGDGLRLPFPDESFDRVTISFGLRNVADTVQALAELRRVTRPGGRLVVCEFATIRIAPVDMLYRRYLTGVLPAIARRAARSPEAYQYLAESIADWPAQRELAGLIEAAGWSAVRWRDLSLGVVAVHVARRPRD